jgi:branched-chain amino acid transport system permease protein
MIGVAQAALRTPRGVVTALVLLFIALVPVIAPWIGNFYIGVFTRMMIWAIAAVSLNLIMGYGGMISFGHTAFLGVAAYAVGIMAYHGVTSAWIQWPVALAVSATVALLFGAIALRTRGVYFIMITLALSQMLYFLSVSARKYGSTDGLVVNARSDFGLPFLDLDHRLTFYYTVFVGLLVCLYLTWRFVNSRFGMVLRGAKSNDARVQAMGFATSGYKLAAFVIAGTMCGFAGILDANLEGFVSPDVLNWPRSGEMIFMVVLGGMGTVFGPLLGALVYWLLQDFLSNWTEHWQIIFGPFLILVVLFARGGIDGFLGPREAAGHG